MSAFELFSRERPMVYPTDGDACVGRAVYQHGKPQRPGVVLEVSRTSLLVLWFDGSTTSERSVRSLDALIEDHEHKVETHTNNRHFVLELWRARTRAALEQRS